MREFETYLGVDAAAALAGWLRVNGFQARIPDPPWQASDGYSGATLHSIILHTGQRDEQLIVKYLPPQPVRLDEPARHRAATTGEAYAFARAHLVEQPYPAVPTAEGGALMFQRPAADGVRCISLADLPAERWPQACSVIVSEILRTWNANGFHSERLTVGQFLQNETGGLIRSTSTIGRWAAPAALLNVTVPWIRLPDDDRTFPNPVLAVLGTLPGADAAFDFVCGRSHGDLHPLNVLIPLSGHGTGRIDEFRLIDLATSRERGPITRDPVYLVLSVAVARIDALPLRRRDELLTAIIEGSGRAEPETPFAVAASVRHAVADALEAADSGWSKVLPLQYLLSVQALALWFTAFESLSPAIRWWLVRLSAEAALRIADTLNPDLWIPEDGRLVADPFAAPPPGQTTVTTAAARRADGYTRDLADKSEAVLLRAYDRIAAETDDGRAAALLEDLCEKAVAHLGAEHAVTLSFQYNRARRMARSGSARGAILLLQETYAAARRTLGDGHPLTRECDRARSSRRLHFQADQER